VKKILGLLCIVAILLQDIYMTQNFFQNVFAQSPGTGIFTIYRDATGGETIGTTPQTLSWDTPVEENPEIAING